MKKLAFLFIALTTLLSLSACRIEKINNDESLHTQKLNLSGFQTIGNYANCDIHFTQSPTYSVTLKATQQWLDDYSVIVRKGELVVRKERKKQKGITVLKINNVNTRAELWISAPTLTGVTMGGGGDFIAESDITGSGLELSVAGSGDAELKNVALTGDFSYTVAGSGDLKAAGIQAKNASLGISGSGDIQCRLTKVGYTELTIAGSGDGDLSFDQCGMARVGISGSGDITLSGTLQSLDKRVSGSGDIDTSKLQLAK